MRRASSPVLIGRKAQVERIDEALDAAGQGNSTILLIGGEAGVGKSRLVEHAMELAAERAMTVLSGGCIELGGTSIPFAPIREAVRGLTDPPRAAIEDLLALFDDSNLIKTTRDRVSPGELVGQAQLFEAWLVMLRRLGAPAAPLLVVEDIHWADGSTLDLLRFTARNQHHTPFVMLATFRTDELHRRHPLLPVLAELQRNSAVSRLEVPPLDRDEIGQLVRQLSAEPVDQALIDRVHGRTEGNPFFAEELISAELSDSTLHISLRDVLLARIAALTEGTQEALRWLAVAGPQVSMHLISRSMGRVDADLEPNLREAVDHHVLVPEDGHDERYRFRHVLMQEAVYVELLPGERTRMHARLAEVMDAADSGAVDPAQLAFHWYSAHDLPRALVAAWDAGQQAVRIHAYADAYTQCARVLELWDQVPDAEQRLGIDRVAVLEQAARTASIGTPDRARALMDQALNDQARIVDRERLALLKEQYGRICYLAGDGITSLEACREAVQLLADAGPTAAKAKVLASLGQILMITMHGDDTAQYCEEAVAVARAVGSVAIEAHALNSLGTTNAYAGNLDLGLEQLHQSLDLASSVSSVEDVSRAHSNLIDVLGHSGRFEEAAAAGAEAFAYAEAHGLAGWGGVVDLCEVGLALYRSGSWAAARTNMELAERYRALGIAEIMIEGRTALLDVAEGRFDEAAARLSRLGPLTERAVEAQLIAPGAEAAAELALWRGHPDEARLNVQLALDRLPADRPAFLSRVAPLFYLGVRAESDICVSARARRQKAEVSEAERRAATYSRRLEVMRDYAGQNLPNFAPQADAWFALCSAETSRLVGAPDPELWGNAMGGFEAIAMPYPAAYAAWRQAEATLTSRGTRSQATESLRRAKAICERLGARPLLNEVESLARLARLSKEVAHDEPAREAIPSSTAGLTEREVEVINLVAAGRTNRQIAEDLFITEGTAGAHVSNILGKLGAQGRTEAAAIAKRLGLLDT